MSEHVMETRCNRIDWALMRFVAGRGGERNGRLEEDGQIDVC